MAETLALVFNPYFPEWSVARSVVTGVCMVLALCAVGYLVDRRWS